MGRTYSWVLVATASGLLASSTLRAQELPKPGPEHEHFKQLVGTWDATVKGFGGESKGTMVYKLDVGGLWLVGNFKGEFGGMPFEGKGLDTFDSRTKKYVGVWVDSMSTTPLVMSGDFDKATGTMTMIGEGRGMDGNMVKMKSVTKMESPDAITFTMIGPGPDGKDSEMIKIHYKRRS
jgi:hypothetical protein